MLLIQTFILSKSTMGRLILRPIFKVFNEVYQTKTSLERYFFHQAHRRTN